MPTIKQKERMSEYITLMLEQGGHKVSEETIRFPWDDKDTRILTINDNQGILLVDDSHHYSCNRKGTEGRTEKALAALRDMGFDLPAFAFYKDGKNFFRNPQSQTNTLRGKAHKIKENRSLKRYSPSDLSRMLELTPVERLISRRRVGRLEYYQPKSDRLEERMIGVHLDPVMLDHTHIPESARYGPAVQESKTLYLITDRTEMPGPLTIADGHIVRAKV